MSEDVAISVSNVYKDFKLPHEKANSVKSIFVNPFKGQSNLKVETQHALKDISFEVKKGEFFGIVGRNGSGKSTLLKIIAGIYQPTKGSIRVNGRLVPFIELGVGFNPELTGRENVYLNGALMGFSTKEVDAKYDAIVDFAELERFMDQRLKNYSSGMQVRLAFSVATILADSDILLIDEVLAVGDADFQRKCFEYFKQLKKNSKTVIFVTHDMDAVREYCNRAILVDGSKLIDTGKPNKIAAMYMALFSEGQKTVGEGRQVWGNKRVEIINPDVIVTQDKVEITYSVVANKATESCIYGFALKDASGLQVLSTNSRINGDEQMNLEKGEVAVSHSFENIFSDGTYTIDLAILGDDGVTVYHWWNDAVSLDVRKPQHTPSVLNMPVKTTLETV